MARKITKKSKRRVLLISVVTITLISLLLVNLFSVWKQILAKRQEKIFYTEELKNGRFELYPTKNMYNFVLIDTQRGFTYQVQWSTDPNSRFIMEIE